MMTEFTRPATWDDLIALGRALDESGAITVDVMPAACGHGWQELSQYSIRTALGEGVELSVLSLEGLLLTKEGLRDKDRADRAVLLRALGRDG